MVSSPFGSCAGEEVDREDKTRQEPRAWLWLTAAPGLANSYFFNTIGTPSEPVSEESGFKQDGMEWCRLQTG
ncbi:hypothetical protein AMELA_G00094310 [Ameiurus melas]|uniref:Uncharacterized protein n=1 Tax=Ameiurus melas TaxID=219545 RepID=A0A7J6AWU0_AMEME|nr:hypothetical protein AMELA_G00094310 [Ameiurus melas]